MELSLNKNIGKKRIQLLTLVSLVLLIRSVKGMETPYQQLPHYQKRKQERLIGYINEGKVEHASLTVAGGASIYIKDAEGKSPLDYAIDQNMKQTLLNASNGIYIGDKVIGKIDDC